MNYLEYQKKIEDLAKKLPKPPFHVHFEITECGSFDIKDNTVLMPCEALRLGKWLVDFYAED